MYYNYIQFNYVHVCMYVEIIRQLILIIIAWHNYCVSSFLQISLLWFLEGIVEDIEDLLLTRNRYGFTRDTCTQGEGAGIATILTRRGGRA